MRFPSLLGDFQGSSHSCAVSENRIMVNVETLPFVQNRKLLWSVCQCGINAQRKAVLLGHTLRHLLRHAAVVL